MQLDETKTYRTQDAPESRPFSYADCPMHEDGRRRSVTRDGREAVLLCDDGPGDKPIVGWVIGHGHISLWTSDGKAYVYDRHDSDCDLLVSPPPKRVVWLNLYDAQGIEAYAYASQHDADQLASANPWKSRLGNRAYSIEID